MVLLMLCFRRRSGSAAGCLSADLHPENGGQKDGKEESEATVWCI